MTTKKHQEVMLILIKEGLKELSKVNFPYNGNNGNSKGTTGVYENLCDYYVKNHDMPEGLSDKVTRSIYFYALDNFINADAKYNYLKGSSEVYSKLKPDTDLSMLLNNEEILNFHAKKLADLDEQYLEANISKFRYNPFPTTSAVSYQKKLSLSIIPFSDRKEYKGVPAYAHS